MIKNNLGGHSGCTILLIEDENAKAFVRKFSSDLNYNKRLQYQCNKQKEFVSDSIKAPRVLDEGYTEDGLFYFDMEYIQGITLAEYMKSMEVSKVNGLVDNIVSNIVSRSTIMSSEANRIFDDKILELRKTTAKFENSLVCEALDELATYDWRRFGKTFCHGDLTLENIIVHNNELYLIDFLDSFYNSWILDIGKLMQDVQTLWSYRNDKKISTNTLIRLIVFRDILIEKICNSNSEMYLNIYHALLLHLVRIYPYTKDIKTISFLNKKVSSVLKIIKQAKEKIA